MQRWPSLNRRSIRRRGSLYAMMPKSCHLNQPIAWLVRMNNTHIGRATRASCCGCSGDNDRRVALCWPLTQRCSMATASLYCSVLSICLLYLCILESHLATAEQVDIHTGRWCVITYYVSRISTGHRVKKNIDIYMCIKGRRWRDHSRRSWQGTQSR